MCFYSTRYVWYACPSIVWDTKTNLEKRMAAEAGANADKMRIAKRAKELNLDAIHDTVHEMAKDEARHGCHLRRAPHRLPPRGHRQHG